MSVLKPGARLLLSTLTPAWCECQVAALEVDDFGSHSGTEVHVWIRITRFPSHDGMVGFDSNE